MRPPCGGCPPLSPAQRGQEAAGPKAEPTGGGRPLPHLPAHSSLPWPQTLHAPPDPAHVAGNGTPQDLFSGPARPLGAPCSPEARTPRPCSGCGQATRPGGWGRCGHTTGPLWSCREPAAQLAHREGDGNPVSCCPGSGEGRRPGWATRPVALGRAHKPSQESSLPLQASSGPPPSGDERGTQLRAWSPVGRKGVGRVTLEALSLPSPPLPSGLVTWVTCGN